MKAFLTPLQGLAEFEQICEKGKKTGFFKKEPVNQMIQLCVEQKKGDN